MRLSRKHKKVFIKKFTRDTYKRLMKGDLVLNCGFPYWKPNQNGRMFPYPMSKREIAKWNYTHLEGGYYNQ